MKGFKSIFCVFPVLLECNYLRKNVYKMETFSLVFFISSLSLDSESLAGKIESYTILPEFIYTVNQVESKWLHVHLILLQAFHAPSRWRSIPLTVKLWMRPNVLVTPVCAIIFLWTVHQWKTHLAPSDIVDFSPIPCSKILRVSVHHQWVVG